MMRQSINLYRPSLVVHCDHSMRYGRRSGVEISLKLDDMLAQGSLPLPTQRLCFAASRLIG